MLITVSYLSGSVLQELTKILNHKSPKQWIQISSIFLKAIWNIWVFSPDLNLLRHFSFRKFVGSEFQIWGALIEKAFSVDLKWCKGLLGLRMLGSELILREYDALGSFKHMRSCRYEGAQWLIALKVRRAILKSILSFTGRKWTFLRYGLMCSRFFKLKMKRTAEY